MANATRGLILLLLTVCAVQPAWSQAPDPPAEPPSSSGRTREAAPAATRLQPDAVTDQTVDPAGAGYSRFVSTAEDVRKRLWSVDGDIDALSQAIRRWLDKNGRIDSPKYYLGESYGGFRGPHSR